MSVSRALFSSRAEDWETPQWLFDALHREFGFTLDAAANERNHKCPVWYGPGSPVGVYDALVWHWSGACWLNPPYGSRIGLWVAKAYEEAASGNATVVCLLPARTDTRWWHRYVMQANEVRLLEGRLRFVGAASSAPFPSAIVVFRQWEVPGKPVFWAMSARMAGRSRVRRRDVPQGPVVVEVKAA